MKNISYKLEGKQIVAYIKQQGNITFEKPVLLSNSLYQNFSRNLFLPKSKRQKLVIKDEQNYWQKAVLFLDLVYVAIWDIFEVKKQNEKKNFEKWLCF